MISSWLIYFYSHQAPLVTLNTLEVVRICYWEHAGVRGNERADSVASKAPVAGVRDNERSDRLVFRKLIAGVRDYERADSLIPRHS